MHGLGLVSFSTEWSVRVCFSFCKGLLSEQADRPVLGLQNISAYCADTLSHERLLTTSHERLSTVNKILQALKQSVYPISVIVVMDKTVRDVPGLLLRRCFQRPTHREHTLLYVFVSVCHPGCGVSRVQGPGPE